MVIPESIKVIRTIRVYFTDSPGQDPMVGVSVVLGMLAVLCMVVFAVLYRRMMALRKNETTDV